MTVAEQLEVPHAGEVRRQVRDWRRGRAQLTLGEVISEAYIAILCTLVVAAMAVSVLLELSGLVDDTCVGSCAPVRALAPWLTVLVLGLVTLGIARLFGPISSPPAANSWLISTPVDRGALLRPAWLWALLVTTVASAVPLGVTVLLAGSARTDAVAVVVAGTGANLLCLALAAVSQVGGHTLARWLTWTLASASCLLLVVVTVGQGEVLRAPGTGTAVVLAGLLLLTAVLLSVRVATRLGDVSRRTLGQNAGLPAALSGSLASLDLGLMYDVLLARRWSGSATVTSHTGGPLGWWALLHRDLLRARRSPQPFVVLAAMLLLVHAVAVADVGRAVVLVTTFSGLLVGPSLCVGLRVVVRTRSLVSMLPMSGRDVRAAHTVVPAVALVAFGLATVPTLLEAMPAREAWAVALACGLSSVAASVRWVRAAPPDYASPLLATPAGAFPPGVMGSLFRGVDVWVVTAVPLLVPGWGVGVSLLLSLGMIAYMVTEDPSA